MKRIILVVCFMVITILAAVNPALTFNPAAHVFIADHLFPNYTDKINLFYGSIAPDLAMYTDEEKWRSKYPFVDTHYIYVDLLGAARGTNQKSFALGWATHNEIWGADFYAHGVFVPQQGYKGGYVTEQAETLAENFPDLLTSDFAHFAIETAIDLLLKRDNHDPKIGAKLFQANLLRSPLDRELLVKVLVFQNPETDWLTLITTEYTFRNLVNKYAFALSLPKPFDKEALINLGVQLAEQYFGIPVTAAQLRIVLDAAIAQCAATDYYHAAILPAIQNIPAHMPH